MSKKPDVFNHQKIYQSEIKPLVDSIKKICALNKIPFFSCVAVANTEKKTTYETDGVLTGYLDLTLTDDRFAKHLCVANGFEVKPKNVVNDLSDVSDFLSATPSIADDTLELIPEELLEE